MAAVRTWTPWLCLAGYAAAGAGLLLGEPGLAVGGGPAAVRNGLWAVWWPTLVGLPLVWLCSARAHRDGMGARITRALATHSIGAEACWLLACLAGFLGGNIVLALLFGLFQPGFDVLAAPVTRVFFLLIVPVLLTDQAGFTLRADGTGMPAIAMRVTEPWRWIGLLPVLLCLAALAVPMRGHLTPHDGFVFGVLIALAAIAIPEEIFFRALLQTRLELLVGRWAGILSASLVFGLVYAVLGHYSELTGPDRLPAAQGAAFAIASYGAIGILYGYVWACYRNIWLNILLRAGIISILVAPAVRLIP